MCGYLRARHRHGSAVEQFGKPRYIFGEILGERKTDIKSYCIPFGAESGLQTYSTRTFYVHIWWWCLCLIVRLIKWKETSICPSVFLESRNGGTWTLWSLILVGQRIYIQGSDGKKERHSRTSLSFGREAAWDIVSTLLVYSRVDMTFYERHISFWLPDKRRDTWELEDVLWGGKEESICDGPLFLLSRPGRIYLKILWKWRDQSV